MLKQWIGGILGIAIVILPFLNLSQTTLMWTLVIIGLAVMITSFWGMAADTTERQPQGIKSRV